MKSEITLIEREAVRKKKERLEIRGAFSDRKEAQHGSMRAESTENSSNRHMTAFKLSIRFRVF